MMKLKTLDKIVDENQIVVVANGMPIRKHNLEKLGTEINVVEHDTLDYVLVSDGLWFHKSWFEYLEAENERV